MIYHSIKQVHRNSKLIAFSEGYHLHLSSYHRYVNNPVRHSNKNIIILECYGKIYYMTNKDVAPGIELLVYYGPRYARNILKLDLNDYYETSPELRAAGFSLNNIRHLIWVTELGFEYYEMRNPPSSFLQKFLRKLSTHQKP